jgi:hypothetical protein
MERQLLDHQLLFDADKFMITKRLYLEMFGQMNYIADYGKCRKYARLTMSNSPSEVKEVREFETKKVHIEL